MTKQDSQTPMITFETRGSVRLGTIELTRMLDISNVSRFGSEALRYLEAHPGSHLMLNFAQVKYLTSAALTELLRINDAAKAGGGSVRLCGLSPEIQKVFRITNLDKLFVLHPDDDVAGALARYERSLQVAADETAWKNAAKERE